MNTREIYFHIIKLTKSQAQDIVLLYDSMFSIYRQVHCVDVLYTTKSDILFFYTSPLSPASFLHPSVSLSSVWYIFYLYTSWWLYFHPVSLSSSWHWWGYFPVFEAKWKVIPYIAPSETRLSLAALSIYNSCLHFMSMSGCYCRRCQRRSPLQSHWHLYGNPELANILAQTMHI